MCVPLSPMQAIIGGGKAGRVTKSILFPVAGLAGAFDKKKKPPLLNGQSFGSEAG